MLERGWSMKPTIADASDKEKFLQRQRALLEAENDTISFYVFLGRRAPLSRAFARLASDS